MPVSSIGTFSTEKLNQTLWAKWLLAGGRLQCDKTAHTPCKHPSTSPDANYSALPMGDVSGFYSASVIAAVGHWF